ncbi:regucalcin isoform X2 [Halyomorpha halys]|uniref:regucalcin isoform X2 n=1 Tax=Halyomorpha halys TaxID=286706 RepID=UPI0006D4FEE0|nr:regucalcin isoform X2 [Halyomorpha halys]
MIKMDPKVEILPIPSVALGEGPHWDIATQSLYLVDIMGSQLIRYDPKANKAYIVKLDVPFASFIIPVEGSKGQFVVGSSIKLYLIKWDGSSDKVESVELLHELIGESVALRINDGKCDSKGRLYFGTMSIEDIFNKRNGKFYSYTKKECCRELASGIGISNGLAWEGNMMYYIDSLEQSVDGFDYNSNGSIENRRKIFDLKKNNMTCFPDGMTIDKDGKLWVACFEGSQVLHVDPKTGKLLNKVPLPAAQITSVAWGGPNLEDLYVTSANQYRDGVDHPNAGCTFRITGLSTSGLPMNEFKL